MSIHIFKELNILGEHLEVCSLFPSTGYKRTGTCTVRSNELTDDSAIVCSVTTPEFLKWGMLNGFDLVTRRRGHWGLNPEGGERWCIPINVWLAAFKANSAPLIIPEATNVKLLQHVKLDVLRKYFV